MLSYRMYKADSPMSDWGTAMFADKKDNLYIFGDTLYSVDSAKLIDINVLLPRIKAQLQNDIDSGYIYNLPEADVDFIIEHGVDYVADGFNPADIIDTAENYDNYELTQWLIDRVIDVNTESGVKVQTGAFVWDENIINR